MVGMLSTKQSVIAQQHIEQMKSQAKISFQIQLTEASQAGGKYMAQMNI